MTYAAALAGTLALAVLPGLALLGAHYLWDRARVAVASVALPSPVAAPRVVADRLVAQVRAFGAGEYCEPGIDLAVVPAPYGWRVLSHGDELAYVADPTHARPCIEAAVVAGRQRP